MANRRTRALARRRDRRKAKASGWARAPKPMGAKIGHGTTGTTSTPAAPTFAAEFGRWDESFRLSSPRYDQDGNLRRDIHRFKVKLGNVARLSRRR